MNTDPADPQPTDRHAESVDGARIGFDTLGDGTPLLLLAGQANSRRWWDPVRPDLASAFTTIAPDHLGTGTSDGPRDAQWTTRRFARDVVAVLDELDVARAHVYGTSMGGRVAQWLAIDHPERIGALVLGCTTGGGAGAVPGDPDSLRLLAADSATARATLIDLMVGPRRRSHPGSVLGDDSMTAHARRAHRRASAGHDAWARLPEITAPTLVLHGTEDRMTPPENGRRLAERIPGARLRLLDGAHHAYFLDRPDATAAVLDFLDEHEITAG